MKKFSFRLESYLRTCRYREQVESLRLNELMNEERQIRLTLEEQQGSLAALSQELSSRREILVFEVGWYRQRMQFICEQIERTERRLGLAEEKVVAQRQVLVEARKKCKVVEKLRERRLERYQFDLDRVQQNEMDDLFLQNREGRPFLAD